MNTEHLPSKLEKQQMRSYRYGTFVRGLLATMLLGALTLGVLTYPYLVTLF